MYRDLSYYEELNAKFDEILGNEELNYEYYQSLTDPEKFILLCSHLIQKIPRPIDKGVRFAAQRDLFSHLSEWRQSPDFKKQIQLLVDSYDAGIKYTDHFIGKFFSFLKSNNLWENTLLVVTSDHGEEFMEHNMLTHGNALYDTLIHVPLIIKMPASSGKHAKRISHLSELVDIMPTLLDILDIPFKGQMQGRSLCPYIYGQERSEKNMVFASFEIGDAPKKRSVRTERWKYIIFDMDFSEKDKFFDLMNDERERRNLIRQKNENIQRLRSHLREHMRECLGLYTAKYSKKRKDEKSFPEELQKRHLEVLQALGYIN
jgi:arylsulfatase A-like enzyme